MIRIISCLPIADMIRPLIVTNLEQGNIHRKAEDLCREILWGMKTILIYTNMWEIIHLPGWIPPVFKTRNPIQVEFSRLVRPKNYRRLGKNVQEGVGLG